MIRSYRELDMQNLAILNMTLEKLDEDPVLPGEARIWFSNDSNLPRIRAGGQNRFLIAPDDDFNFTLPLKETLYINDTFLIYDIENTEYRRMKASVILSQMSTVKDVFKTIHAEDGVKDIVAEGADQIYFNGDGELLQSIGNITGTKSVKYDLRNQFSRMVLAGPVDTILGKPTFRHLTDGDLPSSYNPEHWDEAYAFSQIIEGNPNNVTMEDLGYSVVTTIGDPGLDENIPTEKSVRTLIGTIEPALGNPIADGYVLSSTTAGVRSWIVFPSATYTNATATPSTIGGIASGSTFSDHTMQQMWDLLLYPYQNPALYSFIVSGQTTILESGVFITGGARTFTWGSTNPGNINANSLAIKDETAGSNIATGLANDGTESIDIGSAITVASAYGSQIWSVTGTNSQSAAITKAYFSVIFYSPFYYGIGAAALSVSDIQALTKQVVARSNKTYSFSPTAQKFYFAYPAAHGYLSSIKDPNGFDITSSFTVTTKSFTNNSPNYEGTTMNYYVYESNSLTTQTGFLITFNF